MINSVNKSNNIAFTANPEKFLKQFGDAGGEILLKKFDKPFNRQVHNKWGAFLNLGKEENKTAWIKPGIEIKDGDWELTSGGFGETVEKAIKALKGLIKLYPDNVSVGQFNPKNTPTKELAVKCFDYKV